MLYLPFASVVAERGLPSVGVAVTVAPAKGAEVAELVTVPASSALPAGMPLPRMVKVPGKPITPISPHCPVEGMVRGLGASPDQRPIQERWRTVSSSTTAG